MKTISLAIVAMLALTTMSFAQDEAALAIGDPAPNFELPTFDDQTVTLADHFGEEGHPVVILFSRANW